MNGSPVGMGSHKGRKKAHMVSVGLFCNSLILLVFLVPLI